MTDTHSAGAHNANYYDITTLQEFQAILRQATGRTVVRFYRHGCPACDQSEGTWLEFSRRPEHKSVTFISANLDDNKPLASAMGVDRIPTFVAVERHKTGVKLVGANTEALLRLVQTGNV
jgi:thioredoxin-like negative regulator of GroEL